MEVKVAQLFPILCDPMDYKVHEILQARTLEWVAFPFSREIFPGDLPNPGIKLKSPALQADSLPAEPPGMYVRHCHIKATSKFSGLNQFYSLSPQESSGWLGDSSGH